MDAVREMFLRKAAPPFSAREQAGHYCRRLEGAAGWLLQRLQAGLKASASQQDRHQAQQLCSLFLTDPDMLDVLLALHDIRAAQLRVACPPLIFRLGRASATCSKWDVPTASMAQFCQESLHVDSSVRFINPAIADDFAWQSLCLITDILLAVTVLLAARHSQWEQQRAEAVSSLLILVQGLSLELDGWPVNHDDLKPVYSAKGVNTWHPGLWLRNLASSPITTGWPGQLPAAKRQSTRTQLDLRAWNSYAHICHALTTLALQQLHPLDGMKLFSNHPQGEAKQ
ncbi:hypothetical protein V8C86DRAFT_3144403 [Haematococcus lacustris]